MSDNTSPAIEAKGVYKNYLHNEVLRGFDLTVKQDVSFGCAGINGAGKSTFLKCLLDFCHYNEGTIKLLDNQPGSANLDPECVFCQKDLCLLII